MKRVVLTAVLLLTTACVAQVQRSTSRLSNDDVIQMVSLGLSDDVIVEKIRFTSAANFDTSIDGLKSLKAAKVSDAVLKAMINRASAGQSVPTSTPHDAYSLGDAYCKDHATSDYRCRPKLPSETAPALPASGYMVILSASTRVNPAMGNGKVCWITASDGNTVYTAYEQKYAFGFVSCPVIEMNTQVRGEVDRKQKYLILLLPHGKQGRYTITDMQAAQ